MLEGLPRSKISIIAPGGERRAEVNAVMTGKMAVIDDVKVVVEAGDELRRTLPNGQEEVFDVTDTTFYEGMPGGGITSFFEVAYRKKGTFAPHTGGNYTINVSGANSRVNIGSQDNSTNVSSVANTFDDVRAALSDGGVGTEDRVRIEKLIAAMEAEKGKPGFAEAYQKFIAGVGEHVKIIAPFIPLLSKFIGPN